MTHTSESLTTAPAGLPPALFRHWVHSREEDSGGILAYRPRGFPFPPAFGRDGFELRPDGTFIQFDPGPADGIVRIPGRWELPRARTIAVSFGDADREGYSFAIIALDERAAGGAILRIRRLPLRHPAAGDGADLKAYNALPPATSSRLIDFERAELHILESFPPQFVLAVSDVKPFLNMEVELVPLVYVRQPEYWEIEVVGRLRGIALPALARYTATLRLDGFTGTRGVEVLGATRRERFDVPPGNTDPAAE